MERRQFIKALSVAAVTAPILCAQSAEFSSTSDYSMMCLGSVPGARYLNGRTQEGAVGLVKALVKPFSGTRWRIHRVGNGTFSFECRGTIQGPRWLDGRTKDGTVGLAPNRQAPFTGTIWQVIAEDQYYLLKCLGNIEGPRWLDGRTKEASVGLAASTEPPFTGTKWQIKLYPSCIDSPCNLP